MELNKSLFCAQKYRASPLFPLADCGLMQAAGGSEGSFLRLAAIRHVSSLATEDTLHAQYRHFFPITSAFLCCPPKKSVNIGTVFSVLCILAKELHNALRLMTVVYYPYCKEGDRHIS